VAGMCINRGRLTLLMCEQPKLHRQVAAGLA
jgi:hypothetical protein